MISSDNGLDLFHSFAYHPELLLPRHVRPDLLLAMYRGDAKLSHRLSDILLPHSHSVISGGASSGANNGAIAIGPDSFYWANHLLSTWQAV